MYTSSRSSIIVILVTVLLMGYNIENDKETSEECGEDYKECLNDAVDIYEENSDIEELRHNKIGCDYDYYLCLIT